jgi:hypothetical protein
MGFKYSINENFFDSWSDEMAYVLGFMFADGHIGDYPLIRAKYIVFTNTDRDRIELIKRLLESNHPITTRSVQDKRKPIYVLRIGSHVLFKKLAELKVIPRKSLTMSFPAVPAKHFGAFLLGYFDGDGCVHLELGKKGFAKRLLTIFTSWSIDFLTDLGKTLTDLGLTKRKIYEHGSTKGTYQLRYSTRDSLRLFLCMYNTRALEYLGLERKYAIFKKYLDLRNLTKETIPLVLRSNGPVVKGEHIGLQNQHERVRLPPGPQK